MWACDRLCQHMQEAAKRSSSIQSGYRKALSKRRTGLGTIQMKSARNKLFKAILRLSKTRQGGAGAHVELTFRTASSCVTHVSAVISHSSAAFVEPGTLLTSS